jgi:hypothetical protein
MIRVETGEQAVLSCDLHAAGTLQKLRAGEGRTGRSPPVYSESAPRARPPERSGATGPRERRRWGVRRGEAPRSSYDRASPRVRRSARRDTISGRRFSPETLACFGAGTRTRRIRTPRG